MFFFSSVKSDLESNLLLKIIGIFSCGTPSKDGGGGGGDDEDDIVEDEEM